MAKIKRFFGIFQVEGLQRETRSEEIFQKTLILAFEVIMPPPKHTHLKWEFFFRVLAHCATLKKVQAKKLVSSKRSIFLHEIAFLSVLNFFPIRKLIFGHF